MEKSPAYNYNTGGMDTGIVTGGTTSSSTAAYNNPAVAQQQAPAYSSDNTKHHNNNNDYYAPTGTSSSAGGPPTTHPVGIGAGMDHTRDSMASTAVAPNHQTTATTRSRMMSSSSSFTGSDVLLLIMAIFLPPVAVFLKRGCDAHFFINILLTILAWLPGMIHAFYVVVRYPGDLGDRRGRREGGKRGL